jgi:hypothetical protein
MVGDVNMFLPDGIEEEGECEIMIAGMSPDNSLIVSNLTR